MSLISHTSSSDSLETQTDPLLEENLTDTVDYKGRPAKRKNSGRWRSATFLIGGQVAERFAYCGISSNLITYLTGPLQLSTATAAENVNAWSGVDLVLPFIGAFVADSYLGYYCTIIISSLVYILGLGLLTLSASLPFSIAYNCQNDDNMEHYSCSPSQFQVILFFSSLYLVAIGQAVQKPCIETFGADQFDVQNAEERRGQSSFFNWWFFGVCSGLLIALLIVVYIQDYLSWGLGFGISCIAMAVSLALFLLGTSTYRYKIKAEEKKNPFARIFCVYLAALKNWQGITPIIEVEEGNYEKIPAKSFDQFRFLNKALLARKGTEECGTMCNIDDIEEAKAALRLIPIWTTCLVFAIVIAQCPTFFTKQAATMDRIIFSGFEFPAASLQALTTVTIILLIPVYDCVFVPMARAFTGKPSGITMLQRIGIGMFLSAMCMVIAALIETERLRIAKEHGIVDTNATVPMSVCWLIPQYVLMGAADVFTKVGLQEFFYEQVGKDMKSVGLALYLSVFGVGNFVSSFLVSIVEKAGGWLSDDLNQVHLNYFYCLFFGINVVELVVYVYFAKSYIHRRNAS
ncbi:hypothetical protein SLA2020_021010 [Shorea laevis]